ncbi:VOC family protein [Neobacillus mesonae]|nr:VOC family protein [Neobacillus mesonae]
MNVSKDKASATRIDTVFVPVSDPAKSAEWYMRLFHMELGYQSPDGSYISVRFSSAGKDAAALTLYRRENRPQSEHAAFNFYTPDIHNSYQVFKENGVKVSEIHDAGGMQFFEYWDLDGNMGELVSFPE